MSDEAYMRRALALAGRGIGLTSPNPMVGAVLVKDGRVVGEGSHTWDGVRHAEIIALDAAGASAHGATLYINLEPCSHQGRTPPCADAIVAAGVARVIAGMRDPNPLVAGRGLERLRAAGVRVDEGLAEPECRRLNEHFIRYIQGGVFVTLKAALSLDGRIGAASWPAGTRPRRFTSPESLAHVHRLRHAHDAILSGIGTVLADDPLLTDRSGLPRRRPLVRVVLDSSLRLPLDSRVAGSANNDLLVIAGAGADPARAEEFRRRGVEVACLRDSGRAAWPPLLAALRQRQITSLMIEAGSRLNASAIAAGVVDKLVLFYAPKLFGGDAPAVLAGPADLAAAATPRIVDVHRSGVDLVVEAYLREP